MPSSGLADQVLESVLARVAATPQRLREIIDENREPLIAFTAERKIIVANESGERFFGYGRHELDSLPADQIVPERLRQPDAPPQLATEDLTTVEIPGLRKDGTEIATVWTYGFAPSPAGPIFVMLVLDRARLTMELDALRLGDARYRSLLLASAAIVWIMSPEAEFIDPQPAWESYTGQPFEEHRGAKWISAIHPDDRARVVDDWTAAVRAGDDSYRTHGRIWSARHHAWRAFQTRAVPVRASTGEIIEWIGALTDVQDTVDAQERLARREKELEQRFRAVYENALDGIVLANDELCIVDANPAACRLLGRGRDQLIGTSTTGLIPPADRERAPARMGEFRAAGVMTGEGEMVLPDGTIRRAEFGAVANVSPGLHLSIFRDIEDRKRTEESQQFLDEASRLLTASLDYDETLASVARLAVPRIADWAGVDLLEDDGSFRRVAVAHVDPKKIELANELRRRQKPSIDDPTGIGAVVRTGTPELVELVTEDMLVAALAKDPDLLRLVRGLGLVSGMVVPLFVRGKVVGGISFVSAESRRRFGAADLAFAQELSRRATYAVDNALYVRELAQATRKKDEFLAMLGHELRNPLAPIMTATSLIRARGRATNRELEILERQGRHLVRLVDDLLDISRITSGKLSIKRARVGLADIVAQAIESAAPAIEEKRLRLFVDVGPHGAILNGDRERLVQVLSNILLNSAKFTHPERLVSLTATVESNEAVISICDEGQGIAADLLPRVFDVFTQGQQGTDRRDGGLGLGLSIARSIVVAHGGRIDVTSPGAGLGTTVKIRLPLLTGDGSNSHASEPPKRHPAAGGQRKRRVLIVDDNADSAEMLAAFLNEMGYDSFVAGDAKQALSMAQEVVPDAAILDIGLPEVDGYELARLMREAFGEERAPKMVALTGYATERDRLRALNCGFIEHMAKPIDAPKLASTLRGLFATSSTDASPASRSPSCA